MAIPTGNLTWKVYEAQAGAVLILVLALRFSVGSFRYVSPSEDSI